MFNDESYYYSGIHEFNNINELLQDAKKRFIDKSLIEVMYLKKHLYNSAISQQLPTWLLNNSIGLWREKSTGLLLPI